MILRRITEHIKAQNWFAVGLDFFIVVIGILIAFQITEWNEARQDRIRERAYLVLIATELDQSTASIKYGIELTKERAELGQFLIRAVDDPDLVRSDPGRFVAAMVRAGYTFAPVIRGHAFDEIKSAGDLDIIRDAALRIDLIEFYTKIQGSAQWDYMREVKQTEYIKRGAGILTLEQSSGSSTTYYIPEITRDDAMAAYARMQERPDFIAWLPIVANRRDEKNLYVSWLESAEDLRTRIQTTLGIPLSGSEKVNTP